MTRRRQLRIAGLTKLAEEVRAGLAMSSDAHERAVLHARAQEAVAVVQGLLAERQAAVADLPPPSRRAYAFLSELNATTVSHGADRAADPPFAAPTPLANPNGAPRGEGVRIKGLRRQREAFLAVLEVPGERDPALGEQLREASQSLEATCCRVDLQPTQLSAEARETRGWLAFLAEPERLCSYRQHRDELAEAIEAHRPRAWSHRRLLLRLRPMTGLYRRTLSAGTVAINVPTPMMGLNTAGRLALVRLVAGVSADRSVLVEAMMEAGYQALQRRLEHLGGVAHRSRGVYHDLETAFRRVDRRYFNGSIEAPGLMWSRQASHRKLAHYDPVRDRIVVSALLDSASVPELVIDFIVYHELLHKRHGRDWRNGKAHVHTPAFRADERRFEGWREAQSLLESLALRG